MRNQLKNSFKVSLSLILILYILPVEAQRPSETQGQRIFQEFELSIRNVVQTTDRILEFDIFLLDAAGDQDFELASFQAGILINSDIFSGGTISASLISGSSTLNSQETPKSTDVVYALPAHPNQSMIRLAGRAAPGTGNGTVLSSSFPGSCIIRLRLISSIPFTSNSTADLTFTSDTDTNPLYATRVARYISDVNVQLKVTRGENAMVPENPLLNPTITDHESLLSASSNNAFKVYSYDKAILIENNVGMTGIVFIFDITGREINSYILTNQTLTRIPVLAESGAYIVKICSVKSPFITKVFL
ncbi:MAG: hypothetical protein IPH20_09500 [Bacteroidales bacterium]|nr:hypothetical protein [Bacteroidales bacterium]